MMFEIILCEFEEIHIAVNGSKFFSFIQVPERAILQALMHLSHQSILRSEWTRTVTAGFRNASHYIGPDQSKRSLTLITRLTHWVGPDMKRSARKGWIMKRQTAWIISNPNLLNKCKWSRSILGAYDEIAPYLGRERHIWVSRLLKMLWIGAANNKKSELARQAIDRVKTGHWWENNG